MKPSVKAGVRHLIGKKYSCFPHDNFNFKSNNVLEALKITAQKEEESWMKRCGELVMQRETLKQKLKNCTEQNLRLIEKFRSKK